MFLDLWETNARQMQEAGLETIECGQICTSCNVDLYYSHRAEGGKTGRFGMVAGLPST
jgi:copper oxidase (laccase) domain-containing protein